MKRLLCLLLLILPLTACAVKPPMECVSDEWIAPIVPAHSLTADLPPELTQTAAQEHWTIYEAEGYEVTEEIFSAEDLDAALLHLTGRDCAALAPLRISDYPFDGYRFTWSAAGEGETMICCGALLYDGTHYYALTIQCGASDVVKNREVFAKILSSVGLSAI